MVHVFHGLILRMLIVQQTTDVNALTTDPGAYGEQMTKCLLYVSILKLVFRILLRSWVPCFLPYRPPKLDHIKLWPIS